VRAVVSAAAFEEAPQSTEPAKKHKRHKDKPRKAHRTKVEIDEDDAEEPFAEPAEPETAPDEPAESDEDRKHDEDDEGKKHDEHGKGHGKKR
jgi:hypothetical protein